MPLLEKKFKGKTVIHKSIKSNHIFSNFLLKTYIDLSSFILTWKEKLLSRGTLPLRFDYLAVSFAGLWKALILDGNLQESSLLTCQIYNNIILLCTQINCLCTLQSSLALELVRYILTSFHAENFPVSTISENNELQIGVR